MHKSEFRDLIGRLVSTFDLMARTKDGLSDGDELADKLTNWAYTIGKKDMDQRRTDFINSVRPYLEKYDRKILNEFVKYWTSATPGSWMMRFELKKNQPFDVGRRIGTWVRNNKQFNSIKLGQRFLGSNKDRYAS